MYLYDVLYTLFLVHVGIRGMEASYWDKRRLIVEKERMLAVGGDVILNAREKDVNKVLLSIKKEEIDIGRKNESDFLASRNFIEVKGEILASDVFKIIKKIPKGGSLHGHLFSLASFDYVFNNLTYRDDLYLCDTDGRLKLKFHCDKACGNCALVAEKRKNESFDTWLRQQLTLDTPNPDGKYKTINEVWTHLKRVITATYDLFAYRPVFEEYVYQFLKEHYSDNVFYMEVKAPFVQLYDLNATYDGPFFIDTLWRTVERFKADHPGFVGAKYIYAPYRKINVGLLRNELAVLGEVVKKYPNFVAGVDFVGFEEDGTLGDYVDVLSEVDLQFMFHAGETKWYGGEVDGNLIDAILLGAKRIGHAYALTKHPELMRLVKERDIAIEISPISNQVLKLVTDLRNHPGSSLIAQGFAVVICNDDPGNWGAEGLSFDWYLAFMAMTGEGAGLELLKKLALNSIHYSAMNDAEKEVALVNWNDRWDEFVGEFLEERSKYEVIKL